MKKILAMLLLALIIVPTVAFAANLTSPREIYQSVVGSEPVTGQRLSEQAEAAGKGEEFFNAMKADKENYLKQLVSEGTLTQEEADFLINRLNQNSYADQQVMTQIREKLQNVEGFQGFGIGKGHKGHGMNQGQGGNGMKLRDGSCTP